MRETRLQKANRLYLAGNVVLEDCQTHQHAATVEGDHGVYYCTWDRWNVGNCECEWGQYHASSADVCSHVLAMLIMAGKEHRARISTGA